MLAHTQAPDGPSFAQGVQSVQISGGVLSVAGGDVHHHTHYLQGPESSLHAVLKSIPNYRKIHIATLGKATPGTGLWIFKWETYCLWLEPDGVLQIMWGSGMPGAGKTVLASIVINALEARARSSALPICVAYVYVRYSDRAQSTVRGFLEALIKQTVERHSNCMPLLHKLYANHIREETEPSEGELLELLRSFTKMMAATFYILDALDEAPTEIQVDIVEALASLKVKLFITSRPLKTVEAYLPNTHSFSIVAQNGDLDLHINKHVSRTPELRALFGTADPTVRQEILSSIKQRCDGMFLHASLQLDALRDCTSIRDVMDTLEVFPAQIEDVYLQTWNRILGQTPRKVLLAQRILLWITNAARTITVEELQHAIAASPDTCQFDRNRLVPEATLIALCCGLVAIEEATRLVRLVHYTAQGTARRLVLETCPHPILRSL